MPEARLVGVNEPAFALRDTSPATALHMLILPRRHVASYFDIDAAERKAIHELLNQLRRDIVAQDPTVAGFNIGVNVGEVASQTVFHYHVHLIPRRRIRAAAFGPLSRQAALLTDPVVAQGAFS